MQKALLISVLVATMVIPLRASRIQDRAKAVRRMDRQLLFFCVCYIAALLFLYPLLQVK